MRTKKWAVVSPNQKLMLLVAFLYSVMVPLAFDTFVGNAIREETPNQTYIVYCLMFFCWVVPTFVALLYMMHRTVAFESQVPLAVAFWFGPSLYIGYVHELYYGAVFASAALIIAAHLFASILLEIFGIAGRKPSTA